MKDKVPNLYFEPNPIIGFFVRFAIALFAVSAMGAMVAAYIIRGIDSEYITYTLAACTIVGGISGVVIAWVHGPILSRCQHTDKHEETKTGRKTTVG